MARTEAKDRTISPAKRREQLFLNPTIGIQEDYDRIYKRDQIEVGWPSGAKRLFGEMVRKNTVIIVGAMLGDEGKGRLVDNKLESLLALPGVKRVNVIRYQGGNNAGHTVENKATKLDLHLLPSGVFYEQAVGIIDRGVVVHAEDLQTEVEYVEKAVGDMSGRLVVSPDAILSTDLERAEEILNRIKSGGKADGGTGRGIGPSYAHHYDRLGVKIDDLIQDDWEETMSKKYDQYDKEFRAFGMDLATTDVPDFRATHESGKATDKKVGTKAEFLDRLRSAREWMIDRELVKPTFEIHKEAFSDMSKGVLFEGAQAAGLDAWLGTRPDVTASNTSIFGIREGTGFWIPDNIQEKIGVCKVPHTSSVGARTMPTHIDLAKTVRKPEDLPANATQDQKVGARIRHDAHEFGTTTGRPRDINFLDLEFMRYNARMSGIEVLAATHLDIARADEPIKVCTHYTKDGKVVPYQPGLSYQEGVQPHYIELPGWDGEACSKARTMEDLPDNALRFLAFIQARTGLPFVAATTGAKRDSMVKFPGYSV